jgi:parallel beta-helix repeat protein
MNTPQWFSQLNASLPMSHATSLLLAGLLLGLLACTGGGGSQVQTPSNPAPITPVVPTPPPTPTPTPTPTPKTYGAEFTVSPAGLDSNPGTPAQPFKSLEKARDAARALIAKGVPAGGIAVWLKGGIYERTTALELGLLDSGTSETNTVDWRAVPGETVRITGGRKLDASKFVKVTSSSPVWARLDASAQGQVVQIDLKALGITDYGTLRQRGYQQNLTAALELFVDANPMTLARWPDNNDPQTNGFAETSSPVTERSFGFTTDRASRWGNASEAWVDGYWGVPYADFHLPVASVDPSSKQIVLQNAPLSYGMAIGRPWFIYNLLEELTSPGEWYLDRASGMLYLWPPTNLSPSTDIVVSMMEAPLVSLTKAAYISLQDFVFEASRKNLIDARECHFLNLTGLVMRNSGTSALVTVYATGNRIRRCTIRGCGQEALRVTGGNRLDLARGNNVVEDCEIYNFGRFQPSGTYGVQIEECGNIVRHNHIHDAPDRGIAYWGNDHLIEFNKINNVCLVSNDVGAIYSGRDWGARGNSIRYNFIHNLKSMQGQWANGIYLDDCLSGIRVEGNVLYQCAGAGILLGGGRDNVFVNNLIIKCGYGLFVDSRGQLLLANLPQPGSSGNLLEKLQKLNYQQPLWANAYPACAAIPNSWATITDQVHWVYPEGNIFHRNLGWLNGQWLREQDAGAVSWFTKYGDSIEDQDPLFTDEANLNLSLLSTSPAFLLPGFQPIPFNEIGIQK